MSLAMDLARDIQAFTDKLITGEVILTAEEAAWLGWELAHEDRRIAQDHLMGG